MRNVRDYAIITASYWVFTVTDGAMRMLILFHLHRLGYSPLEVVSLFLFYEVFGVATNFVGGWLGARFGLKSTLFGGLALQIVACAGLAIRAASLTVPVVLVAQAISGIAKDLTKMSSKSYIKLVVPESDSSGLMKWVAILTGSKNALKGVGFFLGAWMLGALGFRGANIAMGSVLLVAAAVAYTLLPAAAGRASSKLGLGAMIARDPRVRWLSAARLLLFGSRDVWFVFALPIFSSETLGWSFSRSGGFLALWVIGYGLVQAAAPTFVGGRGSRRSAPTARRVLPWTAFLVVPLAAIAAFLHTEAPPATVLLLGLAAFGVVFAATSAMHSYLIVRYSAGDEVSLNVGFYYMANAAGRLTGTVLSGAVFQWAGMGEGGLSACLYTSMAFVVASTLLCLPLMRAESERTPA